MKSLLPISILAGLAGNLAAQGPLTPPGPPAPVMKSLAQIEPRSVIPGGTTTHVISQPGNYVLGGDITVGNIDGMRIEADDVTLDLNGFTISTTSTVPGGLAPYRGIFVLSKNVVIRNGRIKAGFYNNAANLAGGGFEAGIEGGFDFPGTGSNVVVEDMQITGCRHGIMFYWPQSSIAIRDCVVRDGESGIIIGNHPNFDEGSVRGCTVQQTTGSGIRANLVTDCEIFVNGNSSPLALDATIAKGCVVQGGSLNIDHRYDMP